MNAVVGYGSVKSVFRTDSAIVIFPDSTDEVNRLVENGVVIQGTLTPVLSILNPAKKVII